MPKKETEMATFQVSFLAQNGYVLTGFSRGIGGAARPQQGRLRHEVASKHRACQTPSTNLTTGNRKRFSGKIGF